VGLGADLRLGSGWVAFACGRYVVQGVRIDGRRRASAAPLGEVGLAFAF
jgi:hypothetical protein